MLSRDTWNQCDRGRSVTSRTLSAHNPSGCWLCKIRRSCLCYMMTAFVAATAVISWILHHLSTASFLHPDPPLSPLRSDLHKSFLESILAPSAIVPSYNMDLTTTSKPILSTMTSIRLFVLGACLCTMLANLPSSFFLQSCFVFYVFFRVFKNVSCRFSYCCAVVFYE